MMKIRHRVIDDIISYDININIVFNSLFEWEKLHEKRKEYHHINEPNRSNSLL